MSDLSERHYLGPMPMRSAVEQWLLCAAGSWVYFRLPADELVFVNGEHGGPCVMRLAEWQVYQRMVERAALGETPVVSMRKVEEEAAPLAELAGEVAGISVEDLGRIYVSLATELRAVRDLVGTAKGSLSVEDYGDALSGAVDRLSVCIGCVEGLGRRREVRSGECGVRNGEAELRADVAELNVRLQERTRDYLATMEELRGENRRLAGLLRQRSGVILSDLVQKLGSLQREGGAA